MTFPPSTITNLSRISENRCRDSIDGKIHACPYGALSHTHLYRVSGLQLILTHKKTCHWLKKGLKYPTEALTQRDVRFKKRNRQSLLLERNLAKWFRNAMTFLSRGSMYENPLVTLCRLNWNLIWLIGRCVYRKIYLKPATYFAATDNWYDNW